MKANAVYVCEDADDGNLVHAVHHDGGQFVVSSQTVGLAIQNFLNSASVQDIKLFHTHLLFAYHKAEEQIDRITKEMGLA